MRNLFKREPGLWVVIILPLIIFAPEIMGLTRFAGVDHTKLNMPIKYFDVLSMRHGEVPLWNPYIATGAPHLAEGEPGTFYLVNIIDYIPGDFFYWYGLNIILHFLIAGITCYFLLRYKGAGIFSATIFAVLFQFAPFTLLHLAAVAMFQLLAWVPLLLLLFDKALNGDRLALNTYWGIFLTFQMICIGAQQLLFFTFVAFIFLGVCRLFIKNEKGLFRRAALFLIVVGIGGAMLAAIQLLPTFEFKDTTIRGGEIPAYFHAHGTWLNWQRLITTVMFPASDFSDLEVAIGFGSSQVYIGMLPLLMVLLAAWHPAVRRKTSPYLWASVILLLFSFGYNFPPYRLLTESPPFSYFRFLGRFSILFVLFSMVSASVAFEMLLQEREKVRPYLMKALISFSVIIIAFFVAFILSGEKAPSAAYVLFAANLLITFIFYYFTMKPGMLLRYIPAVLIILQLVMLYPFARMLTQTKDGFYKTFTVMDKIAADDSVELKRVMNGFDPYVIDPDGLVNLSFKSRGWIIDGMEGLAGILRQVGCMHIYLPLHEMKWKEIIFDRLLLNLKNNPERIEPMNRNILWYLGINYIAVESDVLDVPGFEPYEPEATGFSYRPSARMYRNTNPYPRFFLTRNVKTYKFIDEAGQPEGQWYFLSRQLLDKTPRDIAPVIIPESQHPPLLPDNKARVDGDVRISRDGFSSYELDVSCVEDCYLYVRDDYYPGWGVKVDGQPGPLYQADYINRAVFVESGEHKVEFVYLPDGYRKGRAITLISLIIFALSGLMSNRRVAPFWSLRQKGGL